MSDIWFGYTKIPKKIIQYFWGSETESHFDGYGYQTELLCVDPLCKETAAFQVLKKAPTGTGVTLGWIAFLLTLAGAYKRFFKRERISTQGSALCRLKRSRRRKRSRYG
jgi:hypothetical protein